MPFDLQMPKLENPAEAVPLVATPPPPDVGVDDFAQGPEQGEKGPFSTLVKALGLGKAQVLDRGARLVVRADDRELEIFRASGSVRFTRRGAKRDGGAAPPEERQAHKLAEHLLTSMSLHDESARLLGTDHTRVTHAAPKGRDFEPVPVETHVSYRFRLHGLPVVGAGAQMQVSFDASNEAVRLHKFWRRPAPAPRDREGKEVAPDLRRTLPVERMGARLERGAMLASLPERGTSVTVTRLYLAYYAAPPRETQRLSWPVYVAEGTVATKALGDDPYPFTKYMLAVQPTERERDDMDSIVRSILS